MPAWEVDAGTARGERTKLRLGTFAKETDLALTSVVPRNGTQLLNAAASAMRVVGQLHSAIHALRDCSAEELLLLRCGSPTSCHCLSSVTRQ